MTNQSMVISDAKSGLTMAIAVARSDSTLFSPQPPPNYGCFTRKKLLKKLESCNNGARINGLLDSMRASSPTRRTNDTSDDQNSWTVSWNKLYKWNVHAILITFFPF